MPVVTIARETGAGGAEVGRLIAARLGADLVDRRIIDEVARRLSLPPEEIEEEDEQAPTLVERVLGAFVMSEGPMGVGAEPFLPAADTRDAVAQIAARVMREAARDGNAVVVGRGGSFVLADVPGAVHVFLVAPPAVRARRLAVEWAVEEKEARRRLAEDDERRMGYIRKVHGGDWRNPLNYDLVIDTGRVAYADAAELIVLLAEHRSAELAARPAR